MPDLIKKHKADIEEAFREHIARKLILKHYKNPSDIEVLNVKNSIHFKMQDTLYSDWLVAYGNLLLGRIKWKKDPDHEVGIKMIGTFEMEISDFKMNYSALKPEKDGKKKTT